MPALSYYTNVHNTALVILQKKGYRVWTSSDRNTYYAEKDGWDFIAEEPVQLLGLIAIHEDCRPEVFREYWWRQNEPWLLDSTPSEPPDYEPVIYLA